MERMKLTIHADSITELLSRLDDLKDGLLVNDLHTQMIHDQSDNIVDCNQDVELERL